MIKNDIIYGKKINTWDKTNWENLGLLKNANIDNLKNSVGIYRIIYGDNNVYIGKAVEFDNNGLYKRLRDYTRISDSGRTTEVAREIHENLNTAIVEVLVVGEGKEAIFATVYLEQYFIDKFKPNKNSHGTK